MDIKRGWQIFDLKNLLKEMSKEDIELAYKELENENLSDAKQAFRSLTDRERLQVLIEYLIRKNETNN